MFVLVANMEAAFDWTLASYISAVMIIPVPETGAGSALTIVPDAVNAVAVWVPARIVEV